MVRQRQWRTSHVYVRSAADYNFHNQWLVNRGVRSTVRIRSISSHLWNQFDGIGARLSMRIRLIYHCLVWRSSRSLISRKQTSFFLEFDALVDVDNSNLTQMIFYFHFWFLFFVYLIYLDVFKINERYQNCNKQFVCDKSKKKEEIILLILQRRKNWMTKRNDFLFYSCQFFLFFFLSANKTVQFSQSWVTYILKPTDKCVDDALKTCDKRSASDRTRLFYNNLCAKKWKNSGQLLCRLHIVLLYHCFHWYET